MCFEYFGVFGRKNTLRYGLICGGFPVVGVSGYLIFLRIFNMCQPAGWIFEKNIKNIKIFFAGGDELPRKPEEITIFRRSVMYGGNTRNPVKSSQRGFYRGRLG